VGSLFNFTIIGGRNYRIFTVGTKRHHTVFSYTQNIARFWFYQRFKNRISGANKE
jgi:hypothetical protein